MEKVQSGDSPEDEPSVEVVDDDSDSVICVDDDSDDAVIMMDSSTSKSKDSEQQVVSAPNATSVFCWGSTEYGQLGLGSIEDSSVFMPKEIQSFKVGGAEKPLL